MIRLLQDNVYAAGALLLLRLYLGYQWISAGIHKLTGGFDASGFLTNAVTKPLTDKASGELLYPTYTAFIQHGALPNVKLINFLIPAGETLVGLGLILGALTTSAAFFAVLMNFMFLLSGSVSSNPWFILLGSVIILAGANAGRFGIDHYLQPIIARGLRRRKLAKTAKSGPHFPGPNPTA
ncbi:MULTISPECIES: DoxX family membrane protein [Paenibacillus]|uniref:DoxX family membrane protein n=1 Tax=Paenibacillus TaxID=44249 RepID=UPI0022B91757|nr:DoxX family protein [Paenibacillus caseinilyticus]MCZ8523279.1 DoxX family protein [Paenibacillus caseinilyticus]